MFVGTIVLVWNGENIGFTQTKVILHFLHPIVDDHCCLQHCRVFPKRASRYAMNAKKTIWSHSTVIPPKMFSCVLPDVYRSNLFGSESFSFIESLKLKSIVYLGNETLDEEWVAFCEESNISVVRFQP